MRARTRGSLGVALVVVVVLVVALAAGWAWYVRTPQYAVRMTARAVDMGDWTSFSAYVDVPAVVGSAVDEEIARRFPADSIFRRMADTAKPQITGAATVTVRNAVEARSGRARELPAIAYALGPADIRRLSASAGNARYRVVLPLRGKRVPVTVLLRRQGGRWRIVEVQQIAQLLKQLGVGTLLH